MKKEYLKKGICLLLTLMIFAAAMTVLSRQVKNGRKTEVLLPVVEDIPVYVECERGEPLEVSLLPGEDFEAGGLWLLLVNISSESRGTVHAAVKDEEGSILMDQVIPVETISPGEWFEIPAQMSLRAGRTYTFSFTADGSEPYFMQIPMEETAKALPFEVTVFQKGEALESGISLGISKVTPQAVTFGQIFYFSVPVCIGLLVLATLLILFGREKVWGWADAVPVSDFLGKYGNDLFLLLLFAGICISIYSRAYLRGVYITSDSAGYLREAVNLVNGNGFSYDGMAGYDSWFANWPILYPAMIAFVMKITGGDAYLASKILSMAVVGMILLLIRRCFKKDAWAYALCLTNIGFLNLTYYTWSEIPFLFFLLGFCLTLAKILGEERPKFGGYALLAGLGLMCFLTRYYGIFVWIVTGGYLLVLLGRYRKERDGRILKKTACLTASALVSGCASLAYLLMNKLANGMASGVSRSMWWDDYEKLTNDLIEALLVEIFNVFSLQVPALIEEFPYNMKVLFLTMIFAGLISFVAKNLKGFTRESVLITTGVMYYVIFIGIRYVSSMDTFYFRFFEPGSFLLCMGMAGLLLPYLRGKKGFYWFGGAVGALILIAVAAVFESGGMDADRSYYESLTGNWDSAYEEIPQKSVIIFNDIDFRSSYYRPDVVDGTINPEDTFEGIKDRYYGSDYLCIRSEFARVMLEEGEYESSVQGKLSEGLDGMEEDAEFVIVSLREKEE